MKKAIDNYLNEHENEMRVALSGAIAIPSVKDSATANSHAPFGKEVGRALEFVLKTAEGRRFTAENMENYVGRVRWGGDGTQYAVLTHVDVVPEGTGWSVPPFAGTVKDGRLYGLSLIHISEPTRLGMISYAVFCLKKKKKKK